MEVRVNVCMLVRDRPRLTAQALWSLQCACIGPVNLTVIDDQSQPETRDMLRSVAKASEITAWQAPSNSVQLHLVRNEVSKGTGAARNQAIRESEARFGRSDLLYLSDNDVYFRTAWDVQLRRAHLIWGSRVKVIGGYCHPYLRPNWSEKAAGLTMTGRDAVSGVSWLLDWATWDRYGEFEAKALGVRQSEDWEYCQRIHKDGFEVGALDPWVVVHTGRTDSFGEPAPGAYVASPDFEGVLFE